MPRRYQRDGPAARVALLDDMIRVRRFEEACAELYASGRIRGFLHLYVGQEACAAGVVRALEAGDALVGNYRNSLRHCALRNIGGRMGWRMPALEELLTLVDQTETTPAVPAGAPFEGLIGVPFWTANEEEGDPTLVVTVSLDVFTLSGASKTIARRVLCVRGGRGSTTGTRGGL